MEIENLKTANLVSVILFSGDLNLKIISESIICVNIPKSIDHYVNKKLKIPFFGTNNQIISVRYDLRSRGLRIGGKQLRNTVAIDLQIFNKNIHLKLTNKKIHITGCQDETNIIEIYKSIIYHIEYANKNLNNFKNMEEKIKNNSIEWIMNNFKKEEELLMYDDLMLIDKIESIIDDENLNYSFIKYVSMFSYDCKTIENIKNKINILIKISDNNLYCYDGEIPKFLKFSIVNSIYTYSLKYKVSLIKLTTFLLKNNYTASYHNWYRSKFLDLFIKIDDVGKSSSTDYESKSEDSEESENEDIKKIKGHRFKISSNGAVRQNSPTLKKDAFNVMLNLVNFLNKNSEKFIKNNF
jgi:hypothetical protein